MKKVPSLILLGYLAASLACVTFAWMNEPDPPSGDRAVLIYDADDSSKSTLRVQSKAVTCSVYALDEETADYVNLESLDSLFSKTQIVPGKYISLKFCFSNLSDAKTHVKLSAIDITTNNTEIFKYMLFGVNKETAPVDYYDYQSVVGSYTSFDGAVLDSEGKYTKTLLDDITLIPTVDDQTMDIYCYIMLSKSAGSSLENTSFSLGRFRVIV